MAHAIAGPGASAGGLSEAEASARLAARGRARRERSGRSYLSIVRANVLTVFNLILAAFGAVTLIFGDWRDALFLGVIVANAVIGITQEVRAKHALDRLTLLVAPVARVRRGGVERSLPVAEVVVGDLVALGGRRPGHRRRLARRRRRPAPGRVDPQRRVRAGAAGGRRTGALRRVRRRGHRRVRGHRRRRRQLRRAPHRRGPLVPPPALPAGARGQPAAVRPRRPDARPWRDPRLLALPPPRAPACRGRDLDGGDRDARSRRADAAGQPHLRRGRGAHGAARRARAAAQRDRVARVRRHAVHRQDRHADRAGAASRRGPPRSRRR